MAIKLACIVLICMSLANDCHGKHHNKNNEYANNNNKGAEKPFVECLILYAIAAGVIYAFCRTCLEIKQVFQSRYCNFYEVN